ncbi:hypothetical protein OVA14_07935 [Agrococcus sp. SL85]|uniref:hypothetical protein n=1 Tax=Agrococcus sp. SL85 TaxID=2995141 RepID=UPI00226C9F88|nr:hypothetical protein [Agrococcus sp. SL85]WAC65312.1 hypothetical protein OVA14_07935 [Agrococcus sp. SL85]
MRRTTTRIAAVIAASLLLAGCASTEPEPTQPAGPNGYALAAGFPDGHNLWYDVGDETGLTDLILEDSAGRAITSCLGNGPLLCVAGPDDAYGVLVIAPEGAERAVMTWFGQEVELTRGEGPAEGQPPVFGGVMPPFSNSDGYSLEVFDGAGAVVMTS